ncbi:MULTISPECIES: endopeptidase La [Alcanivoracaceae]|uniref:Lon protease n=2 Tax=Alloalcanivorax profundimaris TaxID=2735259 RepID=A0ABS0AN20_9GAMM|nr:endopeptidase La [Alloalcanivorax profundimaris]MBF1800607.1 endopeptidase La [Alloalcanivorax profundimaris]MBF5055528.1 ATP-dependent protease La [Alloalcanivorax profundimaris]
MLKEIPLLPLRDVVVYPHMVIPLFVGREKSIAALETAMASDKQIMLVAQRNASDDDPGEKDIYRVGTVSTILQMLRLPDGTVKVLVEGGGRGHVTKARFDDDGAVADVRQLDDAMPSESEQDALSRSLLAKFEEYVKLSKKVAPEIMNSVSSIDEISRLADTISAHLQLKLEEKQDVLEMVDVRERVEHLVALMESDMDVLKVEKRIRGRVKKQMEKSQREYYLNEQMKAIQKELGDLDESGNELEDLEKKIESVGMPKDAKEKTRNELNKLRMMSPMSAEATVVRSYLDWMTSVPWKKRSRVRHDIAHAKKILDQDHYGLEEVKERILEFLAVQSRVGKVKGPVLCLVGPPGVGKTSLGQSVARATNRKFVRMALGGVRDEAEIRGHRRTYIGSLPGKVIQKLSKVGVRNPLFLLDEVDKMGMDMRGDPASALLEVLDPEQNHTFSDHYLEVDYDLSETLFVCTSNSMNIPAPLLDRMEVIRLPGYTEDEKVNIASQYLIPKQIKSNGLKDGEVVFSDDTLRHVIRHYTREAGVRGLEREISKICRKVVKEHLLAKNDAAVTLDEEKVEHYLGVRRYSYGLAEEADQVGQVTGLAWTSVGGELLTIEGVSTPGKGRVTTTGSLGDVMQESIQAAWTVVKSRSRHLGIRRRQLERNDLHIHVPEGATPKDGPSAGIGMCTTMVSMLTGIPVRADVAMTGEITLRGQVLAIGGLKEKLLAAHRGGIKTVLIPQENERDLKEIPENIKQALDIRPVKWIDQVLEVALTHTPTPLSEAEVEEDLALAEEKAQKESERPSTH